MYATPNAPPGQKARAFLEERAIPYEFRDIKLDNPKKEELREWQHRSGLPLKRFFNTSGLQYRALGLKDRLPGMDEEEQLDLLAADGCWSSGPSWRERTSCWWASSPPNGRHVLEKAAGTVDKRRNCDKILR